MFLMSLRQCHCRHYRASCTKVSLGFQIRLHSQAKSSRLWISSDQLFSSERSPQPSAPPSNLDVPIALCKGKQSHTNHRISHFIFYNRLDLSFCQFALSLSSVCIPRSYEKAISVPAWKQAMVRRLMHWFLEELGICSLPNEQWLLVAAQSIPWSITQLALWIDIRPDLLLKAIHKRMVWIILRLSPVTCLNSIWIILSVVVNMEWLLFQLDVKKAFLCEDLKEKVYMEQPLGYVT